MFGIQVKLHNKSGDYWKWVNDPATSTPWFASDYFTAEQQMRRWFGDSNLHRVSYDLVENYPL